MTASGLEAYLARIGWTGALEPTREVLAGLLRAHMERIPFENLDVLLGRSIRLNVDSLHAKLIHAKRGGYCYEHATLFQTAIELLGFKPVAHAARVIAIVPKPEAPRTHMFLTVRLDGDTFVLDPGFGGHAPLVPVPLIPGGEARNGLDVHRMVRQDGEWVLEAQIDGVMKPLWTSSLEPQFPVDFVLANHFVSTFPGSPFVTRLMLRALTPDGRVSVMNRDVTIWRGGREEKRSLANRSDLRALLASCFGFDLPEAERLRVPSIPEWT